MNTKLNWSWKLQTIQAVKFSKQKLAKAYGEDEPEYDETMVKEPNEDYKK